MVGLFLGGIGAISSNSCSILQGWFLVELNSVYSFQHTAAIYDPRNSIYVSSGILGFDWPVLV